MYTYTLSVNAWSIHYSHIHTSTLISSSPPPPPPPPPPPLPTPPPPPPPPLGSSPPSRFRSGVDCLPSSARDAVIETTISDSKEPETKSATDLEVLTENNASNNRRTSKIRTDPEGIADTSTDWALVLIKDHSTPEGSMVLV
nr:hypothetical transcript [Hymenolepis microstoma]